MASSPLIVPQPPLITAQAPVLDPQAPLLRAIRLWDRDAAALFDLPVLPPGIDGPESRLAGLLEVAARVRARDLPRVELAELLLDQAEARGAGKESIAAARSLAEPGVVAVLTGQQVGLFGGPALTLYKALGAISTARTLSEAGAPAVPIFWMATFDHDLAEVAQVERVVGGHDRERLRLGGVPGGPLVGQIPLGPGIDGLRQAFVDGLRGLPALDGGLDRVDDELAELYAAPATFGGAFARLLGSLTDHLGLVILDPCDPRFAGLAPARALLARELAARGSWSTRVLARTTADLARRGFAAPIPERRGGRLGVFFTDDTGRRVALVGNTEGIRPLDRSWSLGWPEVAALAEESPGRFTPDVLLRPLLQDLCLPTVAYIGGPSELQYHAQLGALYAELGIPRPVPLCRPSLTLVDVADGEILRQSGVLSVSDVAGTGAPQELSGLTGILRASSAQARAEVVAAAMSGAEEALIEGLGWLQDDGLAALAGELRRGRPLFEGPRGLRAGLGRLQAQVEGLLARLGHGGEGVPGVPGVLVKPGAAGEVEGAEERALRGPVEDAVVDVLRELDLQRSALALAEQAAQIPSGRPLVRARRRLRWLRTQLQKRARRRASAALAALGRLRPQGRPQERSLSLAQLAAWLGSGAADRLLPVSVPATPHTLVAIPRNTAPLGPVGEPAVVMRARTSTGSETGGPVAVRPRARVDGLLRIGVVCLGGLGGSTKVAVEIAAGLAAAGHDIHLFHGSKPEALASWLPNSPASSSSSSVTLHALPLRSTPGPTRRSELENASARLREVSEAAGLDCLHVHYGADLLRCALRAVEGLDIPVVATLHGTDVTPWRRGAGPRGVLAEGLRRCAAVTAVSSWLSEQAEEILALDRAPRVVRNSVDTGIFRPQRDPGLRARLAGADELLLIHVSNLRPVKRPGDAVRILSGLRACGVRARLLIVGAGPGLGKLGEEAAALGVGDALTCVGRLAPDELARYLSVSDVALVPSASESFSLAALEAMACGTPVVGTRCGGLEEVIAAVDQGRGRLLGLLREVGDIAGMVAAIRSLPRSAEASAEAQRAFLQELIRGAGEAFPAEEQLAAYTAILSGVVARRAEGDGVRAAG